MPNNLLSALFATLPRRLDAYVDARIRAATGMVPIAETTADDVFVAGYPRSGNTWFQNLANGLLYHVDPGQTPDRVLFELMPDVHQNRYYKRFARTMLFKSHALPHPSYRRVVYLIRDGRDVMVSYYHFLNALNGSAADFARMVEFGEGLEFGHWDAHVNAWLANPYRAQMITMRFENLKARPIEELRRFCKFAGIERSDAALSAVVEKASFGRMQQKEIEQGRVSPRWPQDRRFVRRGEVGSFRDEMPPDVLVKFMARARQTLRELDYLEP